MKPHDNRAWLLMLPAGAIMLTVGVVPLVSVFNYSFHDIFTLQDLHWVGLDWYTEMIRSGRFWGSLARSLLFSALVLSVQLPLGIWIALVLTKVPRLRTPVLMLVALPLVVPWNMIPVMWLDLISKTGLAGSTLAALGLPLDARFNALHTWAVLVVMDTWHWLGLVVILGFAGLSGIPNDYYRAAAVDGASRIAVFRYIQLPKISGILSIAVLLRFVDSFMIYTEAFRINAGGPHRATTFLTLDLGEEINSFTYGAAAARSMIYFLLVITAAWTFRTVMDRRRGAMQDINS
ncbi:MAG: sugar ABC transporter permease [Rhizobiales bacterium]|nr:sugar ABC transporter permease [Hyphomicrobiales bacterium]